MPLSPGLAAFYAQEIFRQRPEPKRLQAPRVAQSASLPDVRDSAGCNRHTAFFLFSSCLGRCLTQGDTHSSRDTKGCSPPGLRVRSPGKRRHGPGIYSGPSWAVLQASYRTQLLYVLEECSPFVTSVGRAFGNQHSALVRVLTERTLLKSACINARLIKVHREKKKRTGSMFEIRQQTTKAKPEQSLGKWEETPDHFVRH